MDIFKISVPNGIEVGTFDNTTSDTGVLQIHWDELKNITDRLTESETLKHSVSVFGEWKCICAKLLLSLQLTHWRIKSKNWLASG